MLVVPTFLKMGWIESPPYFCVASETVHDVAAQYAELPIGGLNAHHLLTYTNGHNDDKFIHVGAPTKDLNCIMEVYVDDFISLVIPLSQEHLNHTATAVMTGIHDVFPTTNETITDPISYKKLSGGEGAWSVQKEILGLTFDGVEKTIWLSEEKRDKLIKTVHKWIRGASLHHGIPFDEFQSTMSKIQHAFLTIPAGKGLLSPFYLVLAKQPATVYLHRNAPLLAAITDCRTFLRDSVTTPTRCRNLITAWPDYIGIKDASRHGVGGIIIGENKSMPPTVFRFRWPHDISCNVVSASNPEGTLTNSDLEMAGLLLLWLVMEHVCPSLKDAHVALFSDNSPTVHWVQRLAAKHSRVAMQLIRALALRLQIQQSSPLTPLHIEGKRNAMTDIPSRSFGSVPGWHCKTDGDFSHMFNSLFPLPNQASWTVFCPSFEIGTRLTSILRMTPFTADEWRRLPTAGTNIGRVGTPMSHLWRWTLIYRAPSTNTEHAPSQGLQPECEQDRSAAASRLELERSLALSRPLARRFPWPEE